MSLDPSIESGAEHRAPYYRSGIFDPTCRPGGTCPYCQRNRRHAVKRRILAADEQVRDSMMQLGTRSDHQPNERQDEQKPEDRVHVGESRADHVALDFAPMHT